MRIQFACQCLLIVCHNTGVASSGKGGAGMGTKVQSNGCHQKCKGQSKKTEARDGLGLCQYGEEGKRLNYNL